MGSFLAAIGRSVRGGWGWLFGRKAYTIAIIICWGSAATSVALSGMAATAGGPWIDAAWVYTSGLVMGWFALAGVLARKRGQLARKGGPGGWTPPDWTLLSFVAAPVWMVVSMVNVLPNLVTLITTLVLPGFFAGVATMVIGIASDLVSGDAD